MPPRVLSWFSCGAASAVATKLTPAAIPVYCETGIEHADNARFAAECEDWFDRPVIRLRSSKFADCWDLWNRRRWLNGINGALCTVEMKVVPRLEFQRPTDIHVFGYTADGPDVTRAEKLRANYPELSIETPLIDRGINKAGCLALIKGAGLTPPLTYAQGFPNANCLPCVKATSPAYWSLVRKHYPARFERMATLSRELGVRLARLNGERVFIDEIPADHPTTEAVAPHCDFLCAIAEQDLDP